MGLFDIFRKKDIPAEPSAAPETGGTPLERSSGAAPHDPSELLSNALTEIAEIVSDGDQEVLREVEQAKDIQAYYAAHEGRFQERSQDASADPVFLQWLALVDILEEHHYVCERDWKDELPDFAYFFEQLKGSQKLGLTVDQTGLRPEGDIFEWCTILNERWKAQQVTAAAFDIDSDSYVLFPCKADDLTKLQPLAERLGARISIVGE